MIVYKITLSSKVAILAPANSRRARFAAILKSVSLKNRFSGEKM